MGPSRATSANSASSLPIREAASGNRGSDDGVGMIVDYARMGGRVPPPDNEGLQVEDDGSFTMWRSIAPSVGRFAGKLSADALSRLKTEAEKAAAQGDVSRPPTMDGSAERFQVEGATAAMGSDDYIEGPWGQ